MVSNVLWKRRMENKLHVQSKAQVKQLIKTIFQIWKFECQELILTIVLICHNSLLVCYHTSSLVQRFIYPSIYYKTIYTEPPYSKK